MDWQTIFDAFGSGTALDSFAGLLATLPAAALSSIQEFPSLAISDAVVWFRLNMWSRKYCAACGRYHSLYCRMPGGICCIGMVVVPPVGLPAWALQVSSVVVYKPGGSSSTSSGASSSSSASAISTVDVGFSAPAVPPPIVSSLCYAVARHFPV